MAEVKFHIDDDTLWSQILGSAWDYNSWWTSVEYLDGCDWETPGRVRVKIWNPESYTENLPSGVKSQQKTLDVKALADAYGEYLAQGYGRMASLDDLDSTYGDVVMQIAVFGKVVYG